jgi:hypothetical protein
MEVRRNKKKDACKKEREKTDAFMFTRKMEDKENEKFTGGEDHTKVRRIKTDARKE